MLGSILLDESHYPRTAVALAVDDFSLEKHRRIFRCMGELHARGEHIDPLTVAEELSRQGELESVGIGYLTSLDDGLPRICNLDSYARILRNKGTLRRAIFAFQNSINRCLSANGDASEVLVEITEIIATIAEDQRGGSSTIRSVAEVGSISQYSAQTVTYIEADVLPVGAVVGLTGDSGSGKSTLATALAGRANRAGIPVLILDRENPISVVADRLQRLGIRDGPSFRIWGGWLGNEAPQPGSIIIQNWVKACEPRPLVVVDSLIAFGIEDENDSAAMRTFLNQCRRLADLAATVVVLHHDGKSETAKDYRGSSDFKAAVDVAFHVSNFGEDGRLGKLVLRCYKSRYGFVGQVVYEYASGRFVREQDPETVSQTVSEQLTSLLRCNPGITAKKYEELATQRGLGRNRARAFLNDGVLAGQIERKKIGPSFRHSLKAE